MKQLIPFSLTFLIISVCYAQPKTEHLKIIIPEENKWKVSYQEEDSTHRTVEYVPVQEEIYSWTSQIIMLTLKRKTRVNMNAAMYTTFNLAKKNAGKLVLTQIEQGNTAKQRWILFKIEAPSFDDPDPESQLYYIIQGATALFTNTVTIKEKNLSKEFVDKWAKVFKAGKLVYQ